MRAKMSEAIENLPESPLSECFGRACGGAADFSLGEPLFPPPRPAREAYLKAVKSGHNTYAPVQGIPELREAISAKLEAVNRMASRPEEILVTNGANEALAIAMLSIVGRGDEVVICEPSFPAFRPLVKYCMGVPRPLLLREEDGFRIDLDELNSITGKKTKLVVINTPHNPTGSVLGRKTLRAIGEICGCCIISDEAYENLVYGKRHLSLASVAADPDKIITINSFSKTYCMCGYRLGYMHSSADLLKSFAKLKLYTSICTNRPLQMAGVAALADKRFPAMVRREFGKRRHLMLSGLRRLGMPFVEPDGAFYVFPNISRWGDDREVCRWLSDVGVLALPGTAFHESYDRNIRLSFVPCIKDIKKGLARMEKALAGKR